MLERASLLPPVATAVLPVPPQPAGMTVRRGSEGNLSGNMDGDRPPQAAVGPPPDPDRPTGPPPAFEANVLEAEAERRSDHASVPRRTGRQDRTAWPDPAAADPSAGPVPDVPGEASDRPSDRPSDSPAPAFRGAPPFPPPAGPSPLPPPRASAARGRQLAGGPRIDRLA